MKMPECMEQLKGTDRAMLWNRFDQKKDDSVLRVAKQPEKYFLQFSQTIYRVLMFTLCLLDKHKHKRACSLRPVKYQNQTTCTEYCCKHRNWQLKLLLFKEKLNLNDVSPTECLSAASRAAAKSLLGWCHESPQVKGHHVTCVIAARSFYLELNCY